MRKIITLFICLISVFYLSAKGNFVKKNNNTILKSDKVDSEELNKLPKKFENIKDNLINQYELLHIQNKIYLNDKNSDIYKFFMMNAEQKLAEARKNSNLTIDLNYPVISHINQEEINTTKVEGKVETEQGLPVRGIYGK